MNPTYAAQCAADASTRISEEWQHKQPMERTVMASAIGSAILKELTRLDDVCGPEAGPIHRIIARTTENRSNHWESWKEEKED